MAATYEPIATTTLGSAASSITFSSIPGTYTDLRLSLSLKSTSATSFFGFRFNGDTGTNYSCTYMYGNGSTAGSSRSTSVDIIYGNTIYNTNFTFVGLDVFSYAGSTYKTCLYSMANDQNGSGVALNEVGLWRSTSAINSLSIVDYQGKVFEVGTTATLYGIKAA